MSFLRVAVVSLILLSSGCLGQGEGDLEFLGIEYRDPPEAPNFVLFDPVSYTHLRAHET